MGRKKNSKFAAAARARAGKKRIEDISDESDICDWDGTVNHDSESDSEEELSELDGEDLVESIEAERKKLGLPEPLAIIMESAGNVAVWAKAEKNRGLGYNGQSKRTQQHRAQKACEKAKIDEELRKTNDSSAESLPLPPQVPCAGAVAQHDDSELFLGYLSDDSIRASMESDNNGDNEAVNTATIGSSGSTGAPPLKRRRLEVPACVVKAKQKETRKKELAKAFSDIDKYLRSKKSVFHAGQTGLQAYQMRAVRSFLHMVINAGCGKMEAGARAAESHGFAAKYGGRMREVPTSDRGCHKKSFSLLSDPAICAELRSYVRSEKWAINPSKLAEFSQNRMVPAVADKYLRQVVDEEMPRGLKKYLELELFPRINVRAGKKGVSIRTAPNNGKAQSWIFEGEQPLRKKGVGRGLHQSDVICSTYGWLPEASQTLEYGKNYDGYWTGELFVKQLKEKIIPTFEKYHGAGYKALIIVDNSQGHSAYATDALLTSRMNLQPGGKQARLCDGWYLKDNQKVIQAMVFPADHPEHPNEPKGMKQRYLAEHCDYTFETLKENMPKALQSVKVETIRKWEHRMHHKLNYL
ncbi:hypothetical protein PLEOSDRAFT_1077894 [Pleurotus ostreatus PC15]|uniref:DDE-1 domain-containing protein n=1 Tax=Pleurotus ostreatus (strain PC15) TaxID=1137138 RepID=A0A067NE72_PLEO1|nr:hypothetical protein PLEOSDRAFT_1077894 [Pleurotus ostreatus PC15]